MHAPTSEGAKMTANMSTIIARHLRWDDLTIHISQACELSGANVNNSEFALSQERACPWHRLMLYKAERIANLTMDAQLNQAAKFKRAYT